MKKIILSVFVMGSFVGYAIYQNKSYLSEYTSTDDKNTDQNNLKLNSAYGSNAVSSKAVTTGYKDYDGDDDDKNENFVIVTKTSQPVNAVTSASGKSSTVQPKVTPSETTTNPSSQSSSSSKYKDGSYTGSVADAYYGNVQVKAVISGGKLSDVVFLSYPNDRQNSVRINTYATPLLKSEAISAQSANVDAVSGASFTSKAFKESLSSALLQAKA